MNFGGAAANYYDLLGRIHCTVVPRTYVEIGVNDGHSLSFVLPGTDTVGVDPAPHIEWPVSVDAQIFPLTSDDFFATHDVKGLLGDRSVDLAFIDGMHRFEFALRDFANLERLAGPGSTILIHDCDPPTRASADREQGPGWWAGDVWKLIICLRAERPDLAVSVIDVSPTGLGVVGNLDPSSTTLLDRHDELVERYGALDYALIEDDRDQQLNRVPNEWDRVRALLPAAPFRADGDAVDRQARRIVRNRSAKRMVHRLIGTKASYALSRTGRRARGLVTTRSH